MTRQAGSWPGRPTRKRTEAEGLLRPPVAFELSLLQLLLQKLASEPDKWIEWVLEFLATENGQRFARDVTRSILKNVAEMVTTVNESQLLIARNVRVHEENAVPDAARQSFDARKVNPVLNADEAKALMERNIRQLEAVLSKRGTK